MQNPYRESPLAAFLFAVCAALVVIAWMQRDVVWSRVGITIVTFALLAWGAAALERKAQAHHREVRERELRTHRDALLYRTLRARSSFDSRGNLVAFAPSHMPDPLVRTSDECERFDNVVAGWARTAMARDGDGEAAQ